MKDYIKPIIVEENIEIEDMVAASNYKAPTASHNINDAPTDGSKL